MRCIKCNTEFEGIFCPECGMKMENDVEVGKDEEKRTASIEPVQVEKVEQRIHNCVNTLEGKIENKTIKEKNSGTVIEKSREEHNQIDRLKMQLLSTRSQKKRQEIMSNFNCDFTDVEARKRYALLKDKVSMDEPKGILYCRIIGISVLVAIVMIVLLGMLDLVEHWIFSLFVLWYAIFFWVWLIWKIILLVKRFSPYHYLNIKNI